MTQYSLLEQLVERFGFRRSRREPWAPPSDGDFQRLALRVGRPVPIEYRAFLERCGGGIFGNDDFKVVAPIQEPCPWGSEVRPEYFYALAMERSGRLEEQCDALADRLPQGVIPFVPDAGGNQLCLDVAGEFPGSVWFWDHEQRWFTSSLEAAAQEVEAAGGDARHSSAHDVIRAWAHLHPELCDRAPNYMGMYRMADTFENFLLSLKQASY
jgi:SMI1 / KNR4 family (SUKH-1)